MSGVCAVVGGQFGSEGKGLIVGHIANQYQHHVRVGAANAGHTLYTRDEGEHSDADTWPWEKHVMQQIPCAAYANPDAELYIGPGALISPDILEREMATLSEWRKERGLSGFKIVHVDPRAHVITQVQIITEQHSGLAERIGSTSTIAREGIGAAQADRVMRSERCVTFAEWLDEKYELQQNGIFYLDENVGAGIDTTDIPMRLSHHRGILLEGTQGAGLSLTTGDFPYVTSRNTTAAGLAADCGIPPNAIDRVILVCRTFPIRVAGPSGPFFPDSREIFWEDIGVNPESERTTVTKKVRRVATFSIEQIVYAATINGATEIALTFGDYLSPRLKGVTDLDELDSDADEDLLRMIDDIETYAGVPVTMIGTGPHSVIEMPR